VVESYCFSVHKGYKGKSRHYGVMGPCQLIQLNLSDATRRVTTYVDVQILRLLPDFPDNAPQLNQDPLPINFRPYDIREFHRLFRWLQKEDNGRAIDWPWPEPGKATDATAHSMLKALLVAFQLKHRTFFRYIWQQFIRVLGALSPSRLADWLGRLRRERYCWLLLACAYSKKTLICRLDYLVAWPVTAVRTDQTIRHSLDHQAPRSILALELHPCVYVYVEETVLCATCHLSKVSRHAEHSTSQTIVAFLKREAS